VTRCELLYFASFLHGLLRWSHLPWKWPQENRYSRTWNYWV